MSYYRKKPILVEAVQWLPGKQVEGVVRIPASKVDMSKTRGIIFDRPERWVLEHSQEDVFPGDWIVTMNIGIGAIREVVPSRVFDLLYEPAGSTVQTIAQRIKGIFQ